MRPVRPACHDPCMVQTLSPLIREATAIDAETIARVRVASWRASYRGIIDDAYLDALSVDAGRDRYLRGFDPAPAAGFTRAPPSVFAARSSMPSRWPAPSALRESGPRR